MRDLPDDDSWITDDRRAIGAAIRAARHQQHLTQDDVYLAARMSRWTFQRAEAGEEVTISTLMRIARALDVPLRDLV